MSQLMSDMIDFPLIIGTAAMMLLSPGPAVLAVAGTSMRSGRRIGLALATGSITGSWMWSAAAALGMSAVMAAHAWVFEAIRWGGAAYFLYLGLRSARSALTPGDVAVKDIRITSPWKAYRTGLAIHMVNPKAVLFFASIYSLGVSPDATPADLFTVWATVAVISIFGFYGHALLFSSGPMSRGYLRFRRWFEGAFALGFGAVSLRILTARLV